MTPQLNKCTKKIKHDSNRASVGGFSGEDGGGHLPGQLKPSPKVK